MPNRCPQHSEESIMQRMCSHAGSQTAASDSQSAEKTTEHAHYQHAFAALVPV